MPAGARSGAIRTRLRAWALNRQGPDILPLALKGRRVYILPTPAGWMFALLLAVMFIAGMNYGNGLALLFTFWLTGFALVAMVQTQRGLTGTRLVGASASPAHAGDAVMVRIGVAGRNVAQDLWLRVEDDTDLSRIVAPATDDSRDADKNVSAALLALRRGRWRAPPLYLSSTAPFGLFRTWTWLTLDVTTVVYPKAAGTRQPPEVAGENAGSVPLPHGLDELAWLRDFREGDSPRQVAWKAYARGRPLLVREYHGDGALRREFDFELLAGMETEARLSLLTRWILDAHARGEGWILKLPGSPPLAGSGAEHLTACLTRLALHGQED